MEPNCAILFPISLEPDQLTGKDKTMWYFAWLLGLPLAAAFAVINAMWLELQEDRKLTGDDLDV
jgi:cyd operon protein YbgT